MADYSEKALSRRALMRGAVWSVPAIGVAFAASKAVAAPPDSPEDPENPEDPELAESADPDPCGDPSGMVDQCAIELPQEFSSTSFSTSSVSGGTNYSILFSTNISSDPLVPRAATGYEIDSISVAGEKPDGSRFSLGPAVGEAGPRVLNADSASSLGFTLDVVWSANQLVRSFEYTYDVVYLNGLTEVQTCTYVTTMTLDDNGMIAGGVGSVAFSPPGSPPAPATPSSRR